MTYSLENGKTENIRQLLTETNASIPRKREELGMARAERDELALVLEDAEARKDLGIKTEADIPALEKQLKAKNAEVEKLEKSASLLGARAKVLEAELARLLDENRAKLEKAIMTDQAKLMKDLPSKLEALHKAEETYWDLWRAYSDIRACAMTIGVKLPQPELPDNLMRIYRRLAEIGFRIPPKEA